VQLSRHFGAEVTGVCSNANLELVRSLGADHIIDYTAEDFTQNGKKYDIVFDAVGKRSFSECKDSLTPTGIYLTTVPGLDTLLGSFWRKGKRAGFLAAGLRSPDKKVTDLNFLIPLAEAGMLKPVIDRIYPLEDLAEAHKYVKSGRKRGNVVIKVTE
jgi:NADPH:quinone reductase-like Zn-dependent oxidoreductase